MIKEEFENNFNKIFGPSPKEIDWKTANAMSVDNAVYGQRWQGAIWAAKWVVDKIAVSCKEGGEKDPYIFQSQIHQLAKELS